MKTNCKIGEVPNCPFFDGQTVAVVLDKYENDFPALVLVHEMTDTRMTASTCIPEHIAKLHGHGLSTFIKNDDGFEGLLPMLQRAGIIGPVLFEVEDKNVRVPAVQIVAPFAQDLPPIVEFYLGHRPASNDLFIDEMMGLDNESLEKSHDYIQWLFPISVPSKFNPNAPLLDDETIKFFKAHSVLRDRLLLVTERMLAFYGLEMKTGPQGINITRKTKQFHWISTSNHNYLRLTRIMTCLRLLGFEGTAQAIYTCLVSIYIDFSTDIGEETFDYWTKAIVPD